MMPFEYELNWLLTAVAAALFGLLVGLMVGYNLGQSDKYDSVRYEREM